MEQVQRAGICPLEIVDEEYGPASVCRLGQALPEAGNGLEEAGPCLDLVLRGWDRQIGVAIE